MDAITAVTHADPYPYYAEMAARPALFFDEHLKLWIAAGAAEVDAVLRHADLRVRPLAEPVPAALAGGSAGQVFSALVRMNDGQRHAAPRLVLQRALARLDLPAVQARAAALASADAQRAAGPEALSAWMFAVPVRTVASLLGFPDAQLPQVAAWMAEFVACLSPLSSPEQIAGSHRAALPLLDSFKAMLREPALASASASASASGRAQPGSLLAQVLAEADAAGWHNANAILSNLVGVLSQTYEATAGLVGNSIVALMRDPAKAALPGARLVADVMRSDPPIQNTRRFAAQDVSIGGARIEAGQAILVLLAAAGKGYGAGAHGCPGQALSQTIAAAAVDVLLRDGAPPPMAWRYRPSVNARIPEFIQAARAMR